MARGSWLHCALHLAALTADHVGVIGAGRGRDGVGFSEPRTAQRE